MERDREPVVNSDVAFVHGAAEKQWVDDFNFFISDPHRAASARPFDSSLLFNLPAYRFENYNGRKRILSHSHDRNMERVARSSHGRWIAACDAAKLHILSPAQKHSWPCVPSVWRDKKVPFRLWAGTPLVVRTHGLLMVRYPYSSANPLSSDAAARSHACWCAATSQAVQLGTSDLLDECYQHGRIFWLPEDLQNTIRRVGPDSIIGSGPGLGAMLSHLIDSIGKAHWDMVDPCGCQTASNTANGTPVFTSGDAVSWDQSRRPFGELAIISSMRMSPSEISFKHPFGPQANEAVRTNEGAHTRNSLSLFTDEEQQVLGVKLLSAFLQIMDTHKVRCELPDEMRGILEKSRYRIVRELKPPRGQLFDVVPRYRFGALDVFLEQINKPTVSDATKKPAGDATAVKPGHGVINTGKRARETQDEIQTQSASKKRRHTVWEIQPQ